MHSFGARASGGGARGVTRLLFEVNMAIFNPTFITDVFKVFIVGQRSCPSVLFIFPKARELTSVQRDPKGARP